MIYMKDSIGDLFQQETKYHRDGLFGGKVDLAGRHEPYDKSNAQKIQLDPPQVSGGSHIWEVIKSRRSVRQYEDSAIDKSDLSQLLWATQGITAKFRQIGFRAAPSAGALYPIETYVVVNRINGIEPGIYHYEIESHTLAQLKKGYFGRAAARAAMDQGMVERASAVFIWSAVFERSKRKYRDRAYRYVYLDAGHIAQNLALAAVALGLGSCQIGALYDDEVNELLGLDGTNESVVYMSAVGRPK